MKCPYNMKQETHMQAWNQTVNDDNIVVKGMSTDNWTFELQDCLKEKCGAWFNGRCCYASVSLNNQ